MNKTATKLITDLVMAAIVLAILAMFAAVFIGGKPVGFAVMLAGGIFIKYVGGSLLALYLVLRLFKVGMSALVGDAPDAPVDAPVDAPAEIHVECTVTPAAKHTFEAAFEAPAPTFPAPTAASLHAEQVQYEEDGAGFGLAMLVLGMLGFFALILSA